MKHSLAFSLAAALSLAWGNLIPSKTITIPSALYTGPVTVDKISSPGTIDFQKIAPGPNDTTGDWYVLL